MAQVLWLLVENGETRQGWQKRVMFGSPSSESGKRGWCPGRGDCSRGAGKGCIFWVAFKGFPHGLDEEWEGKQAVKDVSRIFSEQLRGKLDPVPITNNNDNKY